MQDQTDYSGSGFNKFLSRGDAPNLSGGLDEQTTINSALAFDRTQTTGALGDTYTVGNVHIDGSANQIFSIDSNNNKRISLGTQTNGSEALIISKEGTDADINRPQDLIFNSTLSLFQAVIADVYTFPGGTLVANTSLNQTFKLAHKVQGVPGYNAFAKIYNTNTAPYFGFFPNSYYTQLVDHLTSGELGSTSVSSGWGIGIDDTYFYIGRNISNSSGTLDLPYAAIPVKYYIFQQTVT